MPRKSKLSESPVGDNAPASSNGYDARAHGSESEACSPAEAMQRFHAMHEKYGSLSDPPEDEYEELPRKQFCLSCGATHYKQICPECGSDAQDDL
jgi:hypothetical protein